MKREKWLDTLKAIACLIVFMDHFYLTFCKGSDTLTHILAFKPLRIVINGNFAVCLFLMASAYVLSVPIYRHTDMDRVRKTAFKRYFRLMLPIFFSSVIVLLISKTIGFANGQVDEMLDNNWVGRFYRKDLSIFQLLYSSLIGVLWEGNTPFNAPFWMLHTLFLGSFLAIILAVLTSKGGRGALALLVAVLAVYLLQDSYYFCMVAGTLLAYIRCRTNLSEKLQANKAWTIVCLLLVLAAICLPAFQANISRHLPKTKLLYNFWKNKTFYNATGGFLLLFAVMNSDKMQRALQGGRLLGEFSKISFSVYLLHWPLMCSVSCWFFVRFRGNFQSAKGFTALLFAMTALLVLAAAKIFYELVEKRICTKITEKLCQSYLK